MKKNTNNRLFTRDCNLVTNSAQQLFPCRRCSLNWLQTPFLSSFIRLFLTLTHLLSLWGYCTCLIKMQHVSSSPNLYPVAWHVLRYYLRDLRVWRKCKPAFSSLGWHCWGWVYNSTNTKIKINTNYCACLISSNSISISTTNDGMP